MPLVHKEDAHQGPVLFFSPIGCGIGQHAFRELILDIYQNRCCLTGLDLTAVNRASQTIGWAEGPKNRRRTAKSWRARSSRAPSKVRPSFQFDRLTVYDKADGPTRITKISEGP